MHGEISIGDTTIMVSDGRCGGNPGFQGFALSITVNDEADVDRLFNPLAETGQVQVPLAATFFAKRFGMVIDKFGVLWMIIKPAHT
jgi:PhnB protein